MSQCGEKNHNHCWSHISSWSGVEEGLWKEHFIEEPQTYTTKHSITQMMPRVRGSIDNITHAQHKIHLPSLRQHTIFTSISFHSGQKTCFDLFSSCFDKNLLPVWVLSSVRAETTLHKVMGSSVTRIFLINTRIKQLSFFFTFMSHMFQPFIVVFSYFSSFTPFLSYNFDLILPPYGDVRMGKAAHSVTLCVVSRIKQWLEQYVLKFT